MKSRPALADHGRAIYPSTVTSPTLADTRTSEVDSQCRALANTMPVTETTPFDCPNCGAQYKLVRVETHETLPDQQLACRKCGGPLHGREGRFVLKYFLVDRPGRKAPGRR